MLSDDQLDELIRATESTRNAYFASLGEFDGHWQPIFNPRFGDGPAWPTRPGWQRIKRGLTSMIVSSGLNDPWFESDENNIGLGVETIVATNDENLPSDLMQMTGTWLYQFATAISNAAASDGHFSIRFDKYGVFLFGLPNSGIDAPDEWLCYDDCFGFLVGLPIPQQEMSFTLPGGVARLLTAKLLTPDEYAYVAERGREGAIRLKDLFTADGSHHFSSLQRPSVL